MAKAVWAWVARANRNGFHVARKRFRGTVAACASAAPAAFAPQIQGGEREEKRHRIQGVASGRHPRFPRPESGFPGGLFGSEQEFVEETA